jgi:spermidine synthase
MRLLLALYLCFFLSGGTALLYEVVWVRILALTFGNTVYAVGLVLAAFMSGLSLGSYLLGRWADRDTNLLKLYGVLEIGIAVFSLASPNLLDAVTSVYLGVNSPAMPFWLLSALRYVLSALVLLVPTTLMGGTLPVLSRFVIRSRNEMGGKLGALYAINTVGGVVGTFLVGFFLVRYFGLQSTIRMAACLNAAVGVAAIYMGGRFSEPGVVMIREKTFHDRPAPKPMGKAASSYAVAAILLSGATAMTYQVAWSRLLINVIGTTTYGFSIILMVFLTGIALGSALVSRFSARVGPGLVHFALVQALIGIVSILTVALFPMMPSLMYNGLQAMGGSYVNVLLLQSGLVFIYIIVPTTLFGATFPIVAHIYRPDDVRVGRGIGVVYAANTAGCILGSIMAAFVMLPALGSSATIKAASVLNIVLALAGFVVLGKRLAVAAAAAILVLILAVPTHIPLDLLDSGVAIYARTPGYKLRSRRSEYLYHKEGLNATISVKANMTGDLYLRTNGKTDAGTTSDMGTQLSLGYFPALMHPDPGDVLVVGLGSGVTIRALLDVADNVRVDCVEIEPAVVKAAELFGDYNGEVLRDPRVRYIIDDARGHLAASRSHYDIIISEPSNPWISGIGSLFTREFFELSASRLRPGGIFCQWVHTYSLRPEDVKTIVGTFSSVFHDTSVWRANKGDILLIGAPKDLPALSYEGVASKIGGKAAWGLRAYLNISDPLDFFSYFETDADGARRLSEGAPLNTDDMPILEFNAPYSMYSDTDTIGRNSTLLYGHMILPVFSQSGRAASHLTVREVLYRKVLNYLKRDIAPSGKWVYDLLGLDPKNPDYQFLRARMIRDHGDRAGAIDKLERLLAKDPDNCRAHFDYANLILDTDPERAENHYRRAAEYCGEFDHMYELGVFLMKKGRCEEALPFLEASEAIPHPRSIDDDLLMDLGVCRLRTGSNEAAAASFAQSAEANPYNARAYVMLGNTRLFLLKMRDEGCKALRKAETHPNLLPEDRAKLSSTLWKYCH